MAEISLDPEAVQELIQGAILNAISTDARDQLIASAIKYLTTGDDRHGVKRGTPLALAFTNAVESAAHRIVMEAVRDDPQVQAKIREVVSPTIASICDGSYDGLPEAIGKAFGAWLQDQKLRG